MELATPHTEEAINLVDKVGGLEWLIHKSEIEGSPALKLDLFLNTPIIIVPRTSVSKKCVYYNSIYCLFHLSYITSDSSRPINRMVISLLCYLGFFRMSFISLIYLFFSS